MPVEHFVSCGNKTCKKREQIAQPDSMPMTWVVLRFIEKKLINQQDGSMQPADVVITEPFCSWRCVRLFSERREADAKSSKKGASNGRKRS